MEVLLSESLSTDFFYFLCTTLGRLQKLSNCKNSSSNNVLQKTLWLNVQFFFKFKFLIVKTWNISSNLAWSVIAEIVEMNEILNVDCNHSYRARSEAAQLIISKSLKTKLLTMSPEDRDRDLLNFILQKRSWQMLTKDFA